MMARNTLLRIYTNNLQFHPKRNVDSKFDIKNKNPIPTVDQWYP